MAMVADPDGNVLALWEDKLPETTSTTSASRRHASIRPTATGMIAVRPRRLRRRDGPANESSTICPCCSIPYASNGLPVLQPIGVGTLAHPSAAVGQLAQLRDAPRAK